MDTNVRFLAGLDDDLKQSVLGQLRDLWTYNSAAIEGNTLSLAETHFVLSEGLTVKGKPVKDHNEVVGHARAIDLLYTMLSRDLIIEDIFNLHLAVQTEIAVDFMRPNGAWKYEPNGTYGVDSEGNQIFIEYSSPSDVPLLMDEWLQALNTVESNLPIKDLLSIYARLHIGFTAIHPFRDGNGRLARLLSNLPLLMAGYPPLVVRNENRQDYIAALNAYSFSVDRPTKESGVWAKGNRSYSAFSSFCQSEFKHTQAIISEAWEMQRNRPKQSSSKLK